MKKVKFILYGAFSVLLMAILMLGTLPAQAQTQPPNATPTPEGLGADDWEQVQAALPETTRYQYQAYLKASNNDPKDNFGGGNRVALSDDTIVVGATGEDSNAKGVNGAQGNNLAEDSGAVYVFVRSGSTWVQQAYLKASNSEAGDVFGVSVAISGDTIVVGAIGEDSHARGINKNQADNSAPGAGAAYVFVRNGGVWSQQAYLKASNSAQYDAFGFAVGIMGDTIAIGAHGEDSAAQGLNGDQFTKGSPDSGAAYIFTRSGNTWQQDAYVKASDSQQKSAFGVNLAISGDTLVVGALRAWVTIPNGHTLRCGAAYVFVRTGGVWSEQAKLQQTKLQTDCDGLGYHQTPNSEVFGGQLGISGDTIVVGATGEDSSARGINGNQNDNSAGNAGAAYVFVRNGTNWSEQAYLKASNIDAGDFFSTVAISENTIVVGASGEDGGATGVDGDQNDNSAGDAGAIYVFKRTGAIWNQTAYLKAPNTDASDNFGSRLAIFGNTIVTGTHAEDSNARGINGDPFNNLSFDSGAVYVLEVPPRVMSSIKDSPNPTTAASVRYKVTFSEPVTGVDNGDFTLTTSNGIANASVISVSGGPKTYTVSVNTGSGSGMLHLDVGDDDSILDMSNIPLGGVGAGNGDFHKGETYIVRPLTEVFYSQAAQDGWVLESAEDSEVGGSMDNTSATFNLGDDDANQQYRAILHFNTGILPDTAVITGAILQIKKHSQIGTDPFTSLGNVRVDIANPRFGTGMSLQLSDFEAASTVAARIGSFESPSGGSLYRAVLNNAGLTHFNLTGTTQFRLRFSIDDNNNLMADYINFYSGNALSTASRPVLIVEYYIP